MDIERTMQFIVEQQAQFWASVQKHDDQIARNDKQIEALTASVQKHDEQIAKNSEQIATLTDLVGRLALAETRSFEQTQARLASLETKTTQFFERMDRFIQGLEANGHKPQSS